MKGPVNNFIDFQGLNNTRMLLYTSEFILKDSKAEPKTVEISDKRIFQVKIGRETEENAKSRHIYGLDWISLYIYYITQRKPVLIPFPCMQESVIVKVWRRLTSNYSS